MPFPTPHPEPSGQKVSRARDALSEHVSFVAQIREEISVAPGTVPERHPLWLLETLLDKSVRLLLAMDEADAARSR